MIEVDADGYDEQDQSEVFDEDNLDEADAGAPTNEFKTFEEIPDVIDVTSARGDGDEDVDALDEADFDAAAVDDEDLEDEMEAVASDGYDESDLDDSTDLDRLQGVDDQESDEAPLVYVGDVEGLRGAQSSAAHFESRAELAEDDVEDLGYGPEADEEES
ncbi:MAG TPA: hypothetical protein VD995_25145 [Azospirillum sp.]|nr:hypothetical protein [Azospirillum sp.]